MYHRVLGYLNTDFFQIFWGYFTEYGKWVFVIESSVVITRSNIVRYYINNYMNCGRISIICRINKRHPISRPNGPAMGCLLCIFVRKLTALLRHRTVSHFRGCKQDTSFCGVTCIRNYMMAHASTMRIHNLISEKNYTSDLPILVHHPRIYNRTKTHLGNSSSVTKHPRVLGNFIIVIHIIYS